MQYCKKLIFVMVAAFFIISCGKKEAPIPEEITVKWASTPDNDGFQSESERAFMHEHGFDKKETFNLYRESTVQQKIEISAHNMAVQTSPDYAAKCVISIALAANFIKTNPNQDPRFSGVDLQAFQKFQNAWDAVATDMIKNNKITSEEAKTLAKNMFATESKKFNNDNDYKIATSKKATQCINEITPFFAQRDLDSYENLPPVVNQEDSQSSPNGPQSSANEQSKGK